MLAGASEAGKSSLLRALLRKSVTLTTKDERTIGLDIERLTLTDPAGRVPFIYFLVYDAGGHDEYQEEMHQIFVTSDTLYLLIWNLAKRPRPGQDAATQMQKMIATCAPGFKVLLMAATPTRWMMMRRCQSVATRWL